MSARERPGGSIRLLVVDSPARINPKNPVQEANIA